MVEKGRESIMDTGNNTVVTKATKKPRKQPEKTIIKESALVSKFWLGGCEWEVHVTGEMPTMMGYCDVERNQIKIRAGMPEQASQVTFYHELVHAILFTMGKNDHNEEFVDSFGNLMYQFMRTMEDVEDAQG